MFCRGNKSVEVKDSVGPADGEQKSGTTKTGPDVGETGSRHGGEKVEDASGEDKENVGVNVQGEAEGRGEEEQAATGRKKGRRFFGGVKPKKNAKPVKISKKNAKVLDENVEVNNNPTDKEEGVNENSRAKDSTEQVEKTDATAAPRHVGSEATGSGVRPRLCCGASSVEVKDSLRPVSRPQVDEAGRGEAGKEVAGDGENEGGEEKDSGEDSYDDDDDIVEGTNVNKEDEEEADEEEEEEDDEGVEKYLKREPPPPRLKKRGKKKQGRTDYVREESPSKSGVPLTFANRKGKYSVTSGDEGAEPLREPDRKTPGRKTRAKRPTPQSSVEHPEATLEMEREMEEVEDTPQKRKKKKKRVPMDTEADMDIRSVYESQMASLAATNSPPTSDVNTMSRSLQPTVEEEGDLLENAEEERKKNKQRLRAKKMKEKEFSSPVKTSEEMNVAYENAQKEIDRVLGPRDKVEEEEEERRRKKKHKSKEKKRKDKEEKKGEDNEAFSDEEKKEPEPESLESARQRMHQLLDDAFSLISHSKTSIGNKVEPSRQSSDEKSSPRSEASSSRSHRKEKQLSRQPSVETEIAEKKHTPLHVQRTHEDYDASGLVSWSPYRAADDTALISLPNAQTNLSTKPPKHEKITTSTFSESLPSSLRTNFYTNQPGEPIVINSRNLASNHPPSETQSGTVPPPGHPVTAANYVSRGTFQNPLYDSSTMDRYSDPYQGMNSFQAIPASGGPNTSTARQGGGYRDGDGRSPRLAQSDRYSSSPRDQTSGVIDVREHNAPRSGQVPNQDVVDVISDSVRPGASPQPLINSLREELQALSSKKMVGKSSLSHGGDREDAGNSDHSQTEPGSKTNGSTRTHGLGEGSSGWGSMPRRRTDI